MSPEPVRKAKRYDVEPDGTIRVWDDTFEGREGLPVYDDRQRKPPLPPWFYDADGNLVRPPDDADQSPKSGP